MGQNNQNQFPQQENQLNRQPKNLQQRGSMANLGFNPNSFLNSQFDPNFGKNYNTANPMIQSTRSFGGNRNFPNTSRTMGNFGGLNGMMSNNTMNYKTFGDNTRINQNEGFNAPFYGNNQNEANNPQIPKGTVLQFTPSL